MKHEKRELQKTVEQLEKNRDYFDQQIWEKEMQYAKNHEEVRKQFYCFYHVQHVQFWKEILNQGSTTSSCDVIFSH